MARRAMRSSVTYNKSCLLLFGGHVIGARTVHKAIAFLFRPFLVLCLPLTYFLGFFYIRTILSVRCVCAVILTYG